MTECAICYEDFGDAKLVQLACHASHRFHRDCLMGWALTRLAPTCPLCRAPIGDQLDLSADWLERARVIALFLYRPLTWGAALALAPFALLLDLRTVGWHFCVARNGLAYALEQAPAPLNYLARPLPPRAGAPLRWLWARARTALQLWLTNELLRGGAGWAQPRSLVLALILQHWCLDAARLPLAYAPELSPLEQRFRQQLLSDCLRGGPTAWALALGFGASVLLAYQHLPPLINQLAAEGVEWARVYVPSLQLEP